MPRAVVKLVEDGYSSEVQRTGSGLQRAFILTMLQHLVLAQSVPAEPQGGQDVENAKQRLGFKLSNLILCIEEPELYQHPNRQR